MGGVHSPLGRRILFQSGQWLQVESPTQRCSGGRRQWERQQGARKPHRRLGGTGKPPWEQQTGEKSAPLNQEWVGLGVSVMGSACMHTVRVLNRTGCGTTSLSPFPVGSLGAALAGVTAVVA